ncbi:hypothetical protein LOZ38_006862, partial [Ophidiomyces ophidiicola]
LNEKAAFQQLPGKVSAVKQHATTKTIKGSARTDIPLGQPGEGVDAGAAIDHGLDVVLAVGVDAGDGAVHLQRDADEAGQPQGEQDERAQQDDLGDQLVLEDQEDDEQHEGHAQAAGGDHEGEDPGRERERDLLAIWLFGGGGRRMDGGRTTAWAGASGPARP